MEHKVIVEKAHCPLAVISDGIPLHTLEGTETLPNVELLPSALPPQCVYFTLVYVFSQFKLTSCQQGNWWTSFIQTRA